MISIIIHAMNRKSFGILVIFFIFLSIIPISVAEPYPIYGSAELSNGEPADGAIVNVTSIEGFKQTYVGPKGGFESGFWQVDVGDPTSWSLGTNFKVWINFTDENQVLSGNKTGIVSDHYSDMGRVVLYANHKNDNINNDDLDRDGKNTPGLNTTLFLFSFIVLIYFFRKRNT